MTLSLTFFSQQDYANEEERNIWLYSTDSQSDFGLWLLAGAMR